MAIESFIRFLLYIINLEKAIDNISSIGTWHPDHIRGLITCRPMVRRKLG